MNNFSKEDLEKAFQQINSLISKCEKAQEKLKLSSPQYSLTTNRIEALKISQELVTKAIKGLEKQLS